LVTGSRLKIGYHITLMMLRAGATVIATTRFPVDSALRYAKEPDFKDWDDRLKIHGLDLRHIPSVEIFCNFIEQRYDRLDVLINGEPADPLATIVHRDKAYGVGKALGAIPMETRAWRAKS
jgi:NAD(P)-dependent dehydrogenase (short-subunit alcohol dehydrogenase family)